MEGRVLIYLGANDGGSLSGLINDYAHVYAFEAQPDNIAKLNHRFSSSPHVHIIWAAVTDSLVPGWTKFNVSSNNVSSSLGTFKDEWLQGRGGLKMTKEISVPTINLNKFCKDAGIKIIHTYMSDIQGADCMVLKTMEHPFLSQRLIREIQTETTKDGRQNIYSTLPSNELSAFRKLLEPHGYTLSATGWGKLTPGQLNGVPDTPEWWEFDSLWTTQSPPIEAPPTTTSTAASPVVSEGARLDLVNEWKKFDPKDLVNDKTVTIFGARKDKNVEVRRVLRMRNNRLPKNGSEKKQDDSKKVGGSAELILKENSVLSEEECVRLSELAWRHVDAIVYINLDSRKDRKDEILAEYCRLRVPEHKIHRFAALKPPAGMHAAVGCNSSHLAILEMAVAKGWKTVLVNEDDFNFIADRKTVWTHLDTFFQKHPKFDVTMLTAHHTEAAVKVDDPNDMVFYARAASNAAGYIVHHTFYQKLIATWKVSLERLKKTGEIHNYITDARQGWQPLQTGDWFMFQPLLGYQRPSFSDLNPGVFCDHHAIKNKK